MLVRLREQMIRGRRRAVSNAKPPDLLLVGVDSEGSGFANDLGQTNPADLKNLRATTLGNDERDSGATTLLGSD